MVRRDEKAGNRPGGPKGPTRPRGWREQGAFPEPSTRRGAPRALTLALALAVCLPTVLASPAAGLTVAEAVRVETPVNPRDDEPTNGPPTGRPTGPTNGSPGGSPPQSTEPSAEPTTPPPVRPSSEQTAPPDAPVAEPTAAPTAQPANEPAATTFSRRHYYTTWRDARTYWSQESRYPTGGWLWTGRHYFFCQVEGEPHSDGEDAYSTWWALTDDDTGNRDVFVSATAFRDNEPWKPIEGLPHC
ncbi:hypothetical protein [Nocardiopsis eucommiae]|uniref:hypothetical protein n=1 Tax=Nocardiopsis eucommiae TaxID=2831970 RepID=UPI003D739827